MGAVVRSVLPLVAAITLSCLSTAPGHEELVSLTMVERAGVDRRGEWITMGVPLPKGRVKSSDDVVLLQDGRPTDAEILPVSRWWDDGTLRWVHLIFPAACPANGKASVTLALGRENTGQEHTLRVRETDEGCAVDTGPLIVNVRKRGFNLIDAATVDGETVISRHGRGLGVRVEGKEFLASLDPNTRVALEEKGPLHVADVHVVHYTPRTHLIGGCRYCPPTDHVRFDPTDSRDHKTAKVYVSDLFNHHKVAGIIERWYSLRDHRSRDVAQMVLDYCYRWTYADNDYGQPRGPGTIMDFCYQGYMLTGERQWIDRAANVLRVHRGRDLNLSVQAGIFLEGMRRYYEMSGDEEAFNYIRNSCDRLIAGNKRGGVTAQAHSFLYRQTGDPKYLQAALDNLPQEGEFDNPWKNYALSMRNAALCLGDLHRIAQEQRAAKETQ